MTPAVSPEWMNWAQAKCDELMPKYSSGPLPFMEFDATGKLVSAWNVMDSDDALDDLGRGVVFAQLLIHHVKSKQDLRIHPLLFVLEVLMAIGRKGDPGWVERGFLGRFAILAMAASLN